MQSPFIWLGSGRTRKRNVGRKGSLLDRAAKSGLPVPTGGILLDDFYRICLAEGLVEIVDSAVVIPDAGWLHEVLYRDVRFPRLEKPVIVRSAADISDGERDANNMVHLDVDFTDPDQMAFALREVWSALIRLKREQAYDILIMKMVTVRTAGIALSPVDSTKDQVTVRVSAENAVPGGLTMDKIGTFQRTSTDLPAYARRLQKLLRGVRRSFGKYDWRIDWADDGNICWLLQIY